MKKLIRIFLVSILSLFTFANVFAANVEFDLEDEEYYNIYKEVEASDLDMDVLDGPGFEEISNSINSRDKTEVLQYIDAHYEDALKASGSQIIITDPNKLKVGSAVSSYNADLQSMSGRDKQIEAMIRAQNKKEEIKTAKEEKKAEEKTKEGNKVTIYIQSMAENPTNPVAGVSYKKTYVFYTECATLTELLNVEGISDDTDFIETIDGIFSRDTEDESYDGEHGMWTGRYWKIFVNGKVSDIGSDLIELKDGMRVRFIETRETVRW